MQRWLTNAGLLIAGIAAILVAACQEKPSTSQSTAPQPATSQLAGQPASMGKGTDVPSASLEMELVGTLAQTGQGFMIISNRGDYSIANQPFTQNLDDMVGRHVKVTATLVEGGEKQDGTHVIDVIRLSEID